MTHSIQFNKATLAHQEVIFQWLNEPHVQAFWDNSEDHRKDILIFLNGRKEPSTYWNGIFVYWIGCCNHIPFCFLLTAPVDVTENLPPLWRKHLSNTGTTVTIDFCIGNKDFLGKQLAAPTLIDFITFYHAMIDTQADTFFIDPDINNPRAKHVYEKAGFQLAGDYVMDQGHFEGHQTHLMVKKIK